MPFSREGSVESGYAGHTERAFMHGSSTDKTEDPWAISTMVVVSIPWNQLTASEKAKRVVWNYICRPILLIFLIYMFICSLDFLTSAFRLLGGVTAGEVLSDNELLNNPIAGLMIGVLTTVLVQSSSTSTSIIVSMVGANLLKVRTAIFIAMGANIGTTVTSTIVSLGQFTDRKQFRRAFAGATVHDMFNWLSVVVLLPLEWATEYLAKLSFQIVKSFKIEPLEAGNVQLLKALTKPFTKYVIQIDDEILAKIAVNRTVGHVSLVKVYCGEGNDTTTKCMFMFMNVVDIWDDWVIGLVLFLFTLVLLSTCLILIVKILNSIFSGHIAVLLKKFVNADFPGCGKYFTGYVAMLIGAALTILLNSSSIFTSALTPLVGVGVITLDRMYPLTLGANIGTTFTAIIASLAQNGDALANSLQVSLCHLFFNLSGMLIWYPIPIMRKLPISLAKKLGTITAKYRWFAGVYLIMLFFALPAVIFGLSVAGPWVLGGVLVPILILLVIIIFINIMQIKKPQALPAKLQNWNFLPLALHSLKPIDRFITKVTRRFRCCNKYQDEDKSLELSTL